MSKTNFEKTIDGSICLGMRVFLKKYLDKG
jgi:hypothetical protein